MVFDNITDKTTFIKKTGSEIITGGSAGAYTVNISSLLDSSGILSTSLADQDEIAVLRKFDHSVSPLPLITSDEAWSAWALPNTNNSGSPMYTLDDQGVITFSQTAADYTWTQAMSGRGADITLPVIASGDTIYILRKTYNLSKFINWTAGSKITSGNLNQSTEQLLFLCQELVQMIQNVHKFNPSVGQPDGICPLDSLGKVPSTNIDINTTLALSTELGVQGTGDSLDKLRIKRLGESTSLSGLAFDGDSLYLATQNYLASDETIKPLSAAMGKELKGLIDDMGEGVSYRGAFDMTGATVVSGTPVAGWTINHIGATGASHANWGDVDTDKDGAADTGSITSGSLLRYNGSMWVVVSVASLLADGSISLTGAWDATGGTITADTQAADTGDATDGTEKRVASCEYVEDAIVNTKLSELGDVDTDTDDAAGNMVYWNGTSWANIGLTDTTPGPTDTLLTTGDSIKDLGDVDSLSPTHGQVLQYTTTGALNKWQSATPTAIGFDVVTCGGEGDGVADESADVNTAVNNANLGHTGTPGSSTVTRLDFRGRKYRIGDGSSKTHIQMPLRQDVHYMNGTFDLDMTNEGSAYTWYTAPGFDTDTTTSTTTGAQVNELPVNDASNFSVGDYLELRPGQYVSSASDVDTRAIVYDTGASLTYKGLGYQIVEVTGIDTSVTPHIIELAEEVRFMYGTVPMTVKKFGTATGSTSTQAKRVVFENMNFTNRNWQKIYYPTADPITKVDSTTAKITLPAGHNMQVNGKISLRDFYTNGALATQDIYSTLNNKFTITAITDTNDVHFTLANAGTFDAATTTCGGSKGYVIISAHAQCLELEGIHDLVLRNCTFENMNSGVTIERCKNVVIENCTFKNFLGESADSRALLLTANENVYINNCSFKNCTTGIRFSHGYASYGSASNDVKIENCTFECEYIGVYSGGRILGTLTIKGCKFRVLLPNKNIRYPKQAVTVNGSVTSLSTMGIYATIVENWDISNNDFNSIIRHSPGSSEPLLAYNANGMYGLGEGIDWNTQVSSEHNYSTSAYNYSGFRRAVQLGSVDIPKTSILTPNESFVSTSVRRIENNFISAWEHTLLIRGHNRQSNNDTTILRPRVSNITIRNNTFHGSYQGIIFDNSTSNTTNNVSWNNILIDNNRIICWRQFKNIPTGESSDSGTIRGIDFNMTGAGNTSSIKCRNIRVTNNILSIPYPTTSSTQAIFCGRTGQPVGTVRGFAINGNYFENWQIGLYFYTSSDNSGCSSWADGQAYGNYGKNIALQLFYPSLSAFADGPGNWEHSVNTQNGNNAIGPGGS